MFLLRKFKAMFVALVILSVVALPAMAQDEVTPEIEVSDQEVMDGTVVVDLVVSDGPGWIVIHADDDGSPGEVIGYEAVSDGENMDVEVEIDTDLVTETLYAMLHVDAEVVGVFEFPGDDVPVQVEGETVTVSFTATDFEEVEDEEDEEVEAVAEEEDDEPEVLPAAGANTLPLLGAAILGLGLLVLGGGLVLKRVRI